MTNIILTAVAALVATATRIFFMALPSVLVLAVLSRPDINANSGVSALGATRHPVIHELFPNSSWNDLVPCGHYFDEQEEFRKARQCVNEKVWANRPLTTNEKDFPIPRCYIIKAQSPNILSKDGINFLPIFDFTGVGAVVGVYQPETRTVFVVENVDAPMVYRHELQHYFLHEHDPETEGGGHDQNIWQQCEPPYYTPSKKAVELGKEENEAALKPTDSKADSLKRSIKPRKYIS
jgi:hypothetical protein